MDLNFLQSVLRRQIHFPSLIITPPLWARPSLLLAVVSLLSCWWKVFQTFWASACSLKTHLNIHFQEAATSIIALTGSQQKLHFHMLYLAYCSKHGNQGGWASWPSYRSETTARGRTRSRASWLLNAGVSPGLAALLVSSPSGATPVSQLPHWGLNEIMDIKALDTTENCKQLKKIILHFHYLTCVALNVL